MVTPPGEVWIQDPFPPSSALPAAWIFTDAASNAGETAAGWPYASDAEIASNANQFVRFMVRRLPTREVVATL